MAPVEGVWPEAQTSTFVSEAMQTPRARLGMDPLEGGAENKEERTKNAVQVQVEQHVENLACMEREKHPGETFMAARRTRHAHDVKVLCASEIQSMVQVEELSRPGDASVSIGSPPGTLDVPGSMANVEVEAVGKAVHTKWRSDPSGMPES